MGQQIGKQIEAAKASGGTRLELDGCDLKKIDKKMISQFPKLQDLSLQSNGLTALTKDIGKLDRLKALNVNNNALKSIPDCVCKLGESLEILSMVSNQVDCIPPAIGNLTRLQRLVLTSNLIKDIPPELCTLDSLGLLYLGSNRITSIPKSLGQLTNMTMLIMYENELEMLPPEIGEMQSLTSLNVSKNKLTELPRELRMLTDLVELMAASNQIKQLPLALGGGHEGLRTLDLSDNELTVLKPIVFRSLQGLRDLDFSGNRLEKIPEELNRCSFLEKLEAHRNRINSFPQAIFSLNQLKHLTLNDNLIENFPEDFEDMIENFEHVDITNNKSKKKTKEELTPQERRSLIQMTVEGGVFIRHPDKHVMSISVTDKHDRILIQNTEAFKMKITVVEVAKIKAILIGRETDVLKKSGHAHREDFYFSLLVADKSEDFEANTPEERDEWVLAIELLMEEVVPGLTIQKTGSSASFSAPGSLAMSSSSSSSSSSSVPPSSGDVGTTPPGVLSRFSGQVWSNLSGRNVRNACLFAVSIYMILNTDITVDSLNEMS